jgi:hypothetical protein
MLAAQQLSLSVGILVKLIAAGTNYFEISTGGSITASA